ncbi:substrate-binding periplasmic protein [Marinobacter nauticus]|uniref:substrate-binding periplasmic protein n=1 Tax=Marinobacter nauticus TaxID=2743 RepID=UPI001C98C2EE|nr:transporter substrate-binding domain-containing protein [Marinobacter nauticus]MBY6103863.1 transporter substrate-binding domain-containing protein [Marinobacter nauticus]
MPRTLLLILALLMAACSPDEATESGRHEAKENATRQQPAPTPDQHRIILAADPWCPHNCRAGAPKEGYMVDIAREIFAEAGFDLEYRNYGWARSLSLARENRIDGVIGALKGDAPDFVFPERSMGTARIGLYTHPESQWQYKGLGSLNGKTLLVINGYSYSPELDRYIADYADDPERVWVISGAAPLGRALRLLAQERTDTFAEDQAVMSWFLQEQAGYTTPRLAGVAHQAPVYIAFAAENPRAEELARLLDMGLARLTETGRLNAIKASYGLSTSD